MPLTFASISLVSSIVAAVVVVVAVAAAGNYEC